MKTITTMLLLLFSICSHAQENQTIEKLRLEFKIAETDLKMVQKSLESNNKLLEENVPVKNIASGLLDELFLDLKINKSFSEAELIWIYESMARETAWIFSSIAPEKAFEVLMYKLALRRSFFTNKIKKEETEDTVPSLENEKPSVATILQAELEMARVEAVAELATQSAAFQETVITATNITTVNSSEKRELTWEGFLTYLNLKSPASASNLEQGNITSPLHFENGELSVELGFGFSGMVFFDYLSDSEVHQKVVNHLAEYFSIDKKKVQLKLKEVQSHETFVSTAAIKEQLAEISMQEKIETFKNNPLLKEAEKMFNAKVDKVIIDNKK